MFSVHTIVSWDFAVGQVGGWNSTIFGPYFIVGAILSGVSAVITILIVLRGTLKNMNYFIRPEHIDALGKLVLIFSMAWAYFFFNDYLVQLVRRVRRGAQAADLPRHRPDRLDLVHACSSATSSSPG